MRDDEQSSSSQSSEGESKDSSSKNKKKKLVTPTKAKVSSTEPREALQIKDGYNVKPLERHRRSWMEGFIFAEMRRKRKS